MIIPNGLYQHFKGEFYIVTAIGKHSETKEEMVCYRVASQEEYWFRSLSVWEEIVKYEGQAVPRFKHISALSKSEQSGSNR